MRQNFDPQIISDIIFIAPPGRREYYECAMKSRQLPFTSIKKKERKKDGIRGKKEIPPFEIWKQYDIHVWNYPLKTTPK